MHSRPEKGVVDLLNDLFLDDHFDRLTNGKTTPNEDELKFIGTYTVASNSTEGTTAIRLDDAKRYYAKSTDELNSAFFLNEEIGKWELGTFDYNPEIKALKIARIYTFNSRIGNKSRPGDVGSSYDILLKGERLLFPTGSEAYKELKRE